MDDIGGNVPRRAKQLSLNVFANYGVGESNVFGARAGREVRFVSMDVEFEEVNERAKTVTVDAELLVASGELRLNIHLGVPDLSHYHHFRYGQRERDDPWWLRRLSYRQVRLLLDPFVNSLDNLHETDFVSECHSYLS